MQERLHIDELKRVEKSVNALLKSWQKLNKSHAQLQEKYAILGDELSRLKEKHQKEIAEMTQQYQDAEKEAHFALSEAVDAENKRWQEKYDEACSAHETTVRELHESHQQKLEALQDEMAQNEAKLKQELAQVSKVKDALTNRVLGVAE